MAANGESVVAWVADGLADGTADGGKASRKSKAQHNFCLIRVLHIDGF